MSGMELKQNLKLTQQLIMTPRLQLAIKMLALNNIELSDMVKQEIAENPVIDMDGSFEASEKIIAGASANNPENNGILQNRDFDGKNISADILAGEKSSEDDNVGFDGPYNGNDSINNDLFGESYLKEMVKYLANYNEQFSDLSQYNNEGSRTKDKDYIIENSINSPQTLYEFIMEQIMTGDFSPQEIELSKYIAGNLDSHGFLTTSRQELLNFATLILKSDRKEDLKLNNGDAERFADSVLSKFGRLEPVGLAAKDIVSSLLIQADYYFKEDNLLKVIISKYLKDIANQNYHKISKETKQSRERILDSIGRLKKLNPKPAANFGQFESRFITPDLYLKKVNGKYVVFMDDNFIPQIKINSYYRKVLNGEIKSSSEMKDYVEDRFKSALWLIKSINTRKETILKIAQLIVDRQTHFFDNGSGHLNPLILKDIATELNIHESTVSRATSNKYISTHLGVFELKSFFSGASYGDASSDTVMARIKNIIEQEKNAFTVYCDSDIMNILNKEGIVIARRTIAKYREIMNIPSSTRRKSL